MQATKIEQRVLSQAQISIATTQYGTPLYLYNFDTIRQQITNLNQYLPKNFHVHYALKANGNLAICQQISTLCQGADVSSLGELHTALKAGFSANQIIFTGPAKSREELSAALKVGCKWIVIESLTEAHRLNQIAKEEDITQDVLIRINPLYRTNNSCDIQHLNGASGNGASTSLKTFICNQGASKFGIDEERIEDALDTIMSLENLNLQGIHIFTESNVLNYLELLASWENTIYIANQLRDKGYPIRTIDFGGGIGIPYNTIDTSFDVQAFGQHLQNICDNNLYEYIVEIGRYIVGDAGMYVTEVLDVKVSQGQTFVLIDGGRHQLCRPPFIAEMNKNMEVLGKLNSPKMKVKIVGKLPTSSDVMIEEMMIANDIAVGEQIVIYTCGAYGFSLSLSNFILHNYPAEVAYQNGILKPIRLRGNPEDFFTNQLMSI